MKGSILIALNDMVERQYGMPYWDALLEEVCPHSHGVYTSTEEYPDRELADILIALSERLDVTTTDIQRDFGIFLFETFSQKYPIFTNLNKSFFPFLMSVNGVIHKEVAKFYDASQMPEIRCEQIEHNQLQMQYQSRRKLCSLAEGLIRGAAKHYECKILFKHDQCMHHGKDCCQFTITTLN